MRPKQRAKILLLMGNMEGLEQRNTISDLRISITLAAVP